VSLSGRGPAEKRFWCISVLHTDTPESTLYRDVFYGGTPTLKKLACAQAGTSTKGTMDPRKRVRATVKQLAIVRTLS